MSDKRILFRDDKRLFGVETRVRCERSHLHIILFHYNICMGMFLKPKKKYDNPLIDLFYNGLCKR